MSKSRSIIHPNNKLHLGEYIIQEGISIITTISSGSTTDTKKQLIQKVLTSCNLDSAKYMDGHNKVSKSIVIKKLQKNIEALNSPYHELGAVEKLVKRFCCFWND